MILHHHRKRPAGFYAPTTLRERFWGRLGFDHLTVTQRLAQLRREAADWKRWYERAEKQLPPVSNSITAGEWS